MSLSEKEQRKFAGQVAFLEKEIESAEAKYAAAQEQFNRTPQDPQTIRDLENAKATLTRALAGRNNPRGEPSNDVARGVSVPGTVGTWLENTYRGLLGQMGGNQEPPPPPGFKVD